MEKSFSSQVESHLTAKNTFPQNAKIDYRLRNKLSLYLKESRWILRKWGESKDLNRVYVAQDVK
jgi:hypothetical protein